MSILERHWYRKSLTVLTVLLLPLSWLFRLLVALRRFLYRKQIFKTHTFPVPVIVVGNITVGGTGKTPFVIWLAEQLRAQGYQPGIVSRGMGGKKLQKPCWVTADADPVCVGDEAVLLVKRTQCPMVVCVNRVAAVYEILNRTACNIVISDDGLQHYRMGRDIEIVLIDGERQLGNRQLLPAGPLREAVSSLQQKKNIVIHGAEMIVGIHSVAHMNLVGETLHSVQQPERQCVARDFAQKKIHAIAGVGNPQRFFSVLRQLGFTVIEHEFPDHHLYQPPEIIFADNLPVVMTEKDAVKCVTFADERHWYLPVQTKVDLTIQDILAKLSFHA